MDRENEKNNKPTDTPWYKIPMVWLVIALPLIVVIAAISTSVIAFKNAPEVLDYNAPSRFEIAPPKK